MAFDTETVPEPGAPEGILDPLRSRLVGISISLGTGEAYYLPLAHRRYLPAQVELLADAGAGAAGETAPPRRARAIAPPAARE